MSCYDIGIPERLHTNNYDSQPFNEDEVLYRRFNDEGKTFSNSSLWSIFPLKNDSTNRSYYSFPEDVLYNSKGESVNDHFYNWGIFSLSYFSLSGVVINCPVNEENKEIQFFISHVPEQCVYPHCEIHVYENGIHRKPNSRIVKQVIRRFFFENAVIFREPTSQ